MKLVYHYHITVKCTANELIDICSVIKGKPTSIDLFNNKTTQIDRMITRYSGSLEGIKNRLLKDAHMVKSMGYEVIRRKIERVTETFEYYEAGMYSEVHIKVADNTIYSSKLFKMSNNSVDGAKFLNARAYSYDEYLLIKAEMVNIPDPISFQYEIAISDSNYIHDQWWTK